jgi:Nuclease-related domain
MARRSADVNAPSFRSRCEAAAPFVQASVSRHPCVDPVLSAVTTYAPRVPRDGRAGGRRLPARGSRLGRDGTAASGATSLAGLLLLTSLGLGLYARHWLALAGRSSVGARSEDEVRRALAPLQAEGWQLRHSLAWRGRGDIDSVAIAPTGVAVAVETKTRTYDARHLDRVHEQAAWLSRRRRRWSRHGALAVLCLVRVRGVERVENDVLVVSIDRLTPALRSAAGALRPAIWSGW